jgi:hypothetical protein
MSAVKRQFFELMMQPGNYASAPRDAVTFPASGHPSPNALAPRFVFILTMNGKPLSVYTKEETAQRDMATLREGDARDGYEATYQIRMMRVDYT